jgi:hypothetical protein
LADGRLQVLRGGGRLSASVSGDCEKSY